jgi:hypothetical protein
VGQQGAVTAAQIKTAYEAEEDTNAFTDALLSKLNGIEANATADQTGAEIKTAYEGESDTNCLTDALLSKLNGIEASATADQTGAEIKTAYEGESDTNCLTDALLSKLNAIEASATADQTGAEIKTAYEAEADTNAYSDAEKAKLGDMATAESGTVQTSDATPTNVLTYTPADGKCVMIHGMVSGRKSDGSQGAGYAVMGAFRRSGATVTQVGDTTMMGQCEDDTDWDVDFAISSTTIQLQVTGKAATTIDWSGHVAIAISP